MLPLGLYIALLALVFLLCSAFQQRIGPLEAFVVATAPVFLILDIKSDVDDIKRLEAQIASIEGVETR